MRETRYSLKSRHSLTRIVLDSCQKMKNAQDKTCIFFSFYTKKNKKKKKQKEIGEIQYSEIDLLRQIEELGRENQIVNNNNCTEGISKD